MIDIQHCEEQEQHQT